MCDSERYLFEWCKHVLEIDLLALLTLGLSDPLAYTFLQIGSLNREVALDLAWHASRNHDELTAMA